MQLSRDGDEMPKPPGVVPDKQSLRFSIAIRESKNRLMAVFTFFLNMIHISVSAR